MLPVGDHNPRHRVPWLTYAFIVINLVVFFLELSGGDSFIIKWSFIPARFLDDPPGQIPTIFSSMFMHAGWIHLLGNMLYLWIFGDNVEDRFGHAKFLVFYLVCGIMATFAHMVFELDSVIPTLGASGAIAGVLGAYLVLFPAARVSVLMGIFFIPLPAVIVIGIWIVLQIFYGIGSLGGAAESGVAYMAHIGGFFTGLAAGIIYRITNNRKNRNFYIN